MRKTSQDGGDNTSITSGVDNEVKKPIVGIMKMKRNSIKKKVQSFSHESDEAVIEPLLQKEKTETLNQSAKCLLPKSKTESSCEKGNDRDKLLSDHRVEKPSLSNAPSICGNISLPNGTKDTMNHLTKSSNTIHNNMNTNVFSSLDDTKKTVAMKSPVFVEIDGNKPTGYNASPLIFTTAKIHTDIKTKSMEPVQVTPGPILSTIEGSSVKMCMNKEISGVTNMGNNTVNTIYIKPNEAESQNIQHARPSTYTNFSPCISTENSIKKIDGLDPKIVAESGNSLSNHSIKSEDISDTNNIMKNTGKNDFNIGTNNALESKKVPLNIGTKDPLKPSESVVDVNKNFETSKIVSRQGTTSDNIVDDKEQLPIQKNPVELNSITGNNTESKITNKSVEKSIIEPKYTTSENVLTKTSDNSNTVIKSTTVSMYATSVLGTSIKKETISTKIPITTTNAAVKSSSTSITPISNTIIESSVVSGTASTTAVSAKNTVANAIPTIKTKVPEEIMTTKASVASVKTPLIPSSSMAKSTATAKTPTSKISAVKSISNSTSKSQIASANTVTMSISGTSYTKTAKPSENPSTNLKSNIKTISTNVDSNKSTNKPQQTTAYIPTSSASSAVIPTVKKQQSTNPTPKSTSGSKSSTTTIITKPATGSATPTSLSGKQTSTKPASTKSTNSSVSSVKTLITSSDKPSNSVSVKTTSTKSSNKQIEAKSTESHKKV